MFDVVFYDVPSTEQKTNQKKKDVKVVVWMSVSELQNSSSVKLCSKDRQLAARVPHAAPDHAEWPLHLWQK